MIKKEKKIVYKVEEGMNPEDILCTTYQMRNFYTQFKDGFFSSLDVMNYIQHHAAAKLAKKDTKILDVCCGRSLMLPLLRYHAKTIDSYLGVDISEANIREAKRGASKKDLKEEDLESYYPFKVEWLLSNVAEMSNHIKHNSMDLIIYTSAIEHMHKDDGLQSLKECRNLLSDNGLMFLSCPNTPGNGYDTQYPAHVYEWGYDELKETLNELGFEIINEIGLVMTAKKMDEFYATQSKEMQDFFIKMKEYVPTVWLTAIMSIPYPKESKEILFIIKKKNNNNNLF